MDRLHEIALAYPRSASQEAFFEGVLCFAQERGTHWSYVTSFESHTTSVLELVDWTGDGVLAALNTQEEADCAAALPMPVVNISGALAFSPVPRSVPDYLAAGRLAAAHLLEKGFRFFAYYGLTELACSRCCSQGFQEQVTTAGFETATLLASHNTPLGSPEWRGQIHRLADWLLQLKRPVGLLATSDYRARQVIDACRLAKLPIPEDVALVGVNNDRLICDHARPRLTSVARNYQQEGYRAAELLDALLRGEHVPLEREAVPPTEVVERDSTATFAVGDPRLRDALGYLHLHLGDPLSIEDLTRHAGVSRRWLEYAFRAALGETPYQYLRRQRLAQARRLLTSEPGAKIYHIAQRSGFASAKQLTIAFHQDFGMSPRDYRRAALT